MMLLAKSQMRFLLRVPWSALTALVGLTLGVASVVAVHQISTGVDSSLRDTTPPHLTELSHLLDFPGLDAEGYFSLRRRWRLGEYPEISAIVPIVEGQAILAGRSVTVIGADWLALGIRSAGGSGAITSDVGLPVIDMLAESQVLAAVELGLAEDQRFTVNGRKYAVAGVLEANLGPVLFADIGVAHELLQLSPQTLSYIGIRVEDSWFSWRAAMEQLMPGLSAGLPDPAVPEALAIEWAVRPVAYDLPSASFARSVLFNLGALGSLALVVAWFLIYQVAVIWLRRQQLLISRLGALGVGPGEFLVGFLFSFAVFGLMATALGIALGQALSGVLVRLSTAGYSDVAGSPELGPWVVGKAVVSGLGVCIVGGWAAFSREWFDFRLRRWLALLLTAFLVALVVIGAAVEASGLLGGFASILALSLLAVMALTVLLRLFRPLSEHLGGRVLLRMGLRDAVWYPRVIGVALAALTLAVATSIAIGLMVESFRLDFVRMLDIRLAGDLYLRGEPLEISQARRWLEAQPEVVRVRASGVVRGRAGGRPVELSYADYDAGQMQRYGYNKALGDSQILISERLSRQVGAGAGDLLEVAGGEFEVVHVFPGFGDPVPRVLVSLAAVRELGLTTVFDRLTVELRDGLNGVPQQVPQLGRQLGPLLGDRLKDRFAALNLQRRDGVRKLALQIFDRTFAVTQALTLLAMAIAVVGMYIALTALRLTQGPTLQLLSFQGVTPRELLGLSALRSLALGGLALLLALPLGLAMAWVLCRIINPRAFGWTVELQFPLSGWLPPLLLGLFAALLAGLLPAPREKGDLDAAA